MAEVCALPSAFQINENVERHNVEESERNRSVPGDQSSIQTGGNPSSSFSVNLLTNKSNNQTDEDENITSKTTYIFLTDSNKTVPLIKRTRLRPDPPAVVSPEDSFLPDALRGVNMSEGRSSAPSCRLLLEQSFSRTLFDPSVCFGPFTQQFRYKSRVYRQPNVDEKQIAKLHTKVRLFGSFL